MPPATTPLITKLSRIRLTCLQQRYWRRFELRYDLYHVLRINRQHELFQKSLETVLKRSKTGSFNR